MEELGLDKDAVYLDVREHIKNKNDPFGVIMQAVSGLKPGQSLALRAPFNPVPLIAVMSQKGYQANSKELGSGDWLVQFKPEV